MTRALSTRMGLANGPPSSRVMVVLDNGGACEVVAAPMSLYDVLAVVARNWKTPATSL